MSRYECWAWVETDDGEDGIVAAVVPSLSSAPVPLMSRSAAVALVGLGPLADAHAEASGHPVRLAHLVEEVKP